jgi:hypothetical protein
VGSSEAGARAMMGFSSVGVRRRGGAGQDTWESCPAI